MHKLFLQKISASQQTTALSNSLNTSRIFSIPHKKMYSIFTCDIFIKLGLAVEIKPKVWIEQFTS